MVFLRIISLVILLLTPSVSSFAGKCKYNIPIRVDSLFSKEQIRTIHRAAQRWTRASKHQICFDIKIVKVDKAGPSPHEKDGLSTIYSCKALWQRKVAMKYDSCKSSRSIACTVMGSRATILSSDIFVIKNIYFYNLMTHELGHLLGIGHSYSPSDLMFWEISAKSSNISRKDKKVLRCIIKANKLLDWKNSCSYERSK